MISLIIPIYNSEKYLADCLRSIQNQTLTDFEAILVNDGSTDRSAEICRQFCEQDARFRLISIPNRGAAGARNVGLQEAKGDYIAFTDSDDWLEPDYLEYLWNGMQKTGADIFYCDFMTDKLVEHDWTDAVYSGSEALCELLTGGCVNRTPNKLYRRFCLDGVLFPEGRNLCEDAAWTAQVLERVHTVGRGHEAKYNIRMTDNSLSRQKRHTESQVCAFYRNMLERCIVLMRQYEAQPNYRKAILEECNKQLTTILESGCNLSKWDVYTAAKKLVNDNAHHFEGARIFSAQCILRSDSYRKAQREYVRYVLLSRKFPVKNKISVLLKQVLAAIRRMR